MRSGLARVIPALILLAATATTTLAANKETINTVAAYSGQHGIRVDVFARNEVGLLEYFNLIVFDDTRLEYAGIAADRGALWYGLYPTHVDGNKIYVHGIASAPAYCTPPDLGDPGSPLYHVTFNVKAGAGAGLAALSFTTEGIWDGHWNDCGGSQINPTPDYVDGGVNVLGPAGHITISGDSASFLDPAIVDVLMHNDLDVFEYFHRILFEDAIVDVDSIVAARGQLSYGNYPTHVSGDTIFVHGWAGSGGCFTADPTYPGAALYRIYITIHPWATPGYVSPLTFLGSDPLWNHWVGCDLVTTDYFTATDGSIGIMIPVGVRDERAPAAATRFGAVAPNPTADGATASYYLAGAGHVELAIHDAAGRRVRSLVKGPRSAGWHDARWDGTDDRGRRVASGIYFYRLKAQSATLAKKIVVLK